VSTEPSDAETIARQALDELPLAGASLHEAYFLSSLSLCVLDAVFSIGVTYEATAAVVRRYCDAYQLTRLRRDRSRLPQRDEQESLDHLIQRIDQLGPERFAIEVVHNRQRTSSRGGILKSAAALSFARVLARNGIQYFEDLPSFDELSELYRELQQVHGQASGISIGYFWMLAGNDDLVKPDRMILGYLSATLARHVGVPEARRLMTESSQVVRETIPNMTPRLLDFVIWQFQRDNPPMRTTPAAKSTTSIARGVVDPLFLDQLILGAIDDLSRYLATHEWRGRENELINLFVFGHLLPAACPPNGSVDPTQIGIEVAVPQLADWGENPKTNVRKDLVIRRSPRATSWTRHEGALSPVLAILEWKSLNNVGVPESAPQKRREHQSDIGWLTRMTAQAAGVSGYAVFADLTSNPPVISCTVVRSGLVLNG
jgi:hypothetical protein